MTRAWNGLLLLMCLQASPPLVAQSEELYLQAVHILGGNGNVVSRWNEPIRLLVVDGGRPTPARRIVKEAAAIAGLLLITPAEAATDVSAYQRMLESTPPYALGPPCPGSNGAPCFNFVVVLASNAQMLSLAKTVPLPGEYERMLRSSNDLHCFFAPFRSGRQQIRQVVIYVRHDLDAAMLQTCLQEEIYQSFGLFADYPGSTLFSFNDVVAPKQITRFDRELLAALYDSRVKPGYPVGLVVSIFLERIRAQNAR